MTKKRCKKGKSRSGPKKKYCVTSKGVSKRKSRVSTRGVLSEAAFETQKKKIVASSGTSVPFLERQALWANLDYDTYKKQYRMLHGGSVPVSKLEPCKNGKGKDGWRIAPNGSCYDLTGGVGKRMNIRHDAYMKRLEKKGPVQRWTADQLSSVNYGASTKSVGVSGLKNLFKPPVDEPRSVVPKMDEGALFGLPVGMPVLY